MMVLGGLGILIAGVVVVAFMAGLGWAWSSYVYLPINSMVFVQSWNGKIRKETRPGVHFLHPFEWVMSFCLSSLSGYESSTGERVRYIPTSHVHIKMYETKAVSEDSREILIDSWMMLRIADPEKLLINGCKYNSTYVLFDAVRSRIIDQCSAIPYETLTKRPFRPFDLKDIESKFGVEITINIRSICASGQRLPKKHNK